MTAIAELAVRNVRSADPLFPQRLSPYGGAPPTYGASMSFFPDVSGSTVALDTAPTRVHP